MSKGEETLLLNNHKFLLYKLGGVAFSIAVNIRAIKWTPSVSYLRNTIILYTLHTVQSFVMTKPQ